MSSLVRLKLSFTPAFLAGARVEPVRQSLTTSTVTVRLLERVGAYEVGDEIAVSPAELEALGAWRVMCRVSGGVTGTRGPTPLKLFGVEQRFETYEDAQRAAANAMRAVSPHAQALFEYWPEEAR